MRATSFSSGKPEPIATLGIVNEHGIYPSGFLGASAPVTIEELLADWPANLEHLGTMWASTDPSVIRDDSLPADKVKLLAPVRRPGKVICVGVNYSEHAKEGGRDAPDHPILFAKFPTSVIGHGGEIRWDPGLTQAVDLEAELAVVIGRTCRRVAESEALEYVAGYTCLNDVSARDLQFADKQFVRGKSLDTFCPIGPWLVTRDEIPDPQALRISSFINDEPMQDASTSEMVFGVAELIAYCSRAFTLEPGDIIATGTPSGVGWYSEPRRMLRDGDVTTIEIEGIGRLVNRCVEERAE
jgi:2-keto-4-pentenoate hydratase/2-oxohepta-3-ene-1,7-dioic acid hydratase in catechol pathway